jgi:hypothetical protein
MSEHTIDDTLHDGFIDSWLVAGPHVREVTDLDRYTGADYKHQIMRRHHDPAPGFAGFPAELETCSVDGVELQWRAYRCDDDHFVDLSKFYHLTSHLRAWAYAEVDLPAARIQPIAITTNAPADVWINGAHAFHTDQLSHQIPATATFDAQLSAGRNRILVRFEAIAARECPYVLAVRLVGAAALPVRLPTSIGRLELREKYERIFAAAYLEQDVYARGDRIVVRWPDDFPAEDQQTIAVRLQDTNNRIYYEGLPVVRAGASSTPGNAVQFRDGAYKIVLMPHPDVYYLHNMRVTREIPFTVLHNTFSAAPYGDYEARRIEALEDAAKRQGQIYAEIARMELGNWAKLDRATIDETIHGINQRKDCSDFYLIGLLGALIRYGDDPAFPAELREQIRACALGFRYWMDDPGADAMWFASENHQILFHACEALAGQLFADEVFSNTGERGAWHLARGTEFASEWLRRRAASGFREWDSNCYFEHDVLALAHLADLAAAESLREMAAVVLDKLLYTMALNSFRGAFGSTHGRTYAPYIKGARQELTSGIGRLLWGMGVYNTHILGSVALACARGYELPSVIGEIAVAPIQELWSRERHRQELTFAYDRDDGVQEVNKVTYRTADYMLCSAQDYNAGKPGYQQHIWQATLSHDAAVFVTHPPCVSEDGSHRPNFWHGNVVLPRVAQWYDTLIDVRSIPENDWMGFTHAFFPTFAFDEHVLRDGWAFARIGDGYLAITAAQGIELMRRGNSAYRELRSYGAQNVWLCMLGRAMRDGSFAEFQERILALDIAFDGLQVRCATLRGEALRFGWEGPLTVDGVEQPLSGFKHYESPLCTCEMGAETMEIAGWEDVLQLQLR